MRNNPMSLALIIFCLLTPLNAKAQKNSHRKTIDGTVVTSAPHKHFPKTVLINSNDGLALISAALESRHRTHTKPDCSHLVHSVYERAGFPYPYASSSDLYDGITQFRRVRHPQPGDLVVWPGHAGIEVNPSQNSFFGAFSSGIGVESYASPYWKERGTPRFYRYAKTTAIRSEKVKPRSAKLNPADLDSYANTVSRPVAETDQ